MQVLSLPGLASLATFGEKELQQPYGLWVREMAGGEREVLVTDAYMAGTDALGAFAGNMVANTDGVWLQQAATSRFPQGVFYAVHGDMAVAAFDWRDVASALSVRADCDV